ncbi:outer membrane beta-barrel family protein [Chryseobacterium indologenes]|uniref:outer membrane beta-barrel family protein n=1 Tax=Chryseobacterium indologenes TaxID=253 RepID=UPI001BCB6E91|nr:outer membrane beta-barrel family protein [Chryseobacterium indologenes]
MRNILSLFLFLSIIQTVYSQEYSAFGKVIRENGSPVSSAEVILSTKSDSVLVKATVTDDNGKFTLGNLPNGKYALRIQHKSTAAHNETLEINNESIDLGAITTYQNTILIDKIVIVKPLLEKKINKTIINVENSVYKVGQDTYRLLNISPEIQTDNIGNITFRGNESVTVYMDGRKIQLGGRELMDYLKSIPSESIKNIEISSVPSAEFDASTKGAIININTKSNYKYGLSGTVYNELQQHRHFQWNAGMMLVYRKKKIITQANYTYGTGRGFVDNHDRQTFFNRPIQLNQHEDYKEKIGAHNLSAGLDYNINEKNVIGANYILSYWSGTTTGVSTNSIKNTSDFNVDSIYVTKNEKPLTLRNQTFNTFYRYKIDSLGSKIDAGYNFISYNNHQESYLDNNFFNKNNQIMRPGTYLSIKNPLKINIHTFNLDYNKVFKNELTAQLGSKYVISKTNNSIQFFDGLNQVFNPILSNDFVYDEKLLAFYSSINKKWGKWGMNLGLRVENTNYNANSITTSESFSQNRWDLFPSVFVEYKPSDDNTLNFSYGRRITRPPYKLLNPFENIEDPFFISKGNPFLKPYFSNSFELNYLLNKKHNFTLLYQRSTDVINNIFVTNVNSQTISSYDNINDEEMYLASFSTFFDIYKWWNFNAYANIVYRRIKVNNAHPQSYEKATPYIRINNTFKIKDDFFIEINGSYFARSFYSVYDLAPQAVVNMSFRKSFFKNKLNVNLSFNDPFNIKRIRVNVNETDFNRQIENRLAIRSVSLRMSYNFSKGKKNTNREQIQSTNSNEVNRINQ